MWYYEWQEQPFGPVSKETVAEALRSGKINQTTRVWREGMPDWKPLVETELAVLAGVTPPQGINASPELPVQRTQPVTGSFKSPSAVSPEKIAGLTKIFSWWIVLALFTIPFNIISTFFSTAQLGASLVCVFYIPILGGIVLQYILVYRFWQVVQDGNARTTPGKAVGFLFIPVYNLYWFFVAFVGLSKDMNGFIDRHFSISQVRKTHPWLSICYVILFWLSMINLGYVYIKLISYSFSIISNPSSLSPMPTTSGIITFILGMVQLVILIALFFDYYKTTLSISKADKTNQ